MKQLLSILLSGCLLLGSNASVNAQATSEDSINLSGDWYLQPALASDTATGHVPTIHLDLAQRKFTGFTGCNQMSGNFRVQGNSIVFGENVLLTKMVCVGYNEKEFVANLLRVNSYSFENGLLVLQIDRTPISRWRKKGAKETI